MKSILLLSFLFAFKSFASAPLVEKINFICSQISSSPNFKYEDNFSQSFIGAVKYEVLVSILSDVYNDSGSCKEARLVTQADSWSKFKLITQAADQRFIISIDEKGLISGLQYLGRSEPLAKVVDEASIKNELSKFGGFSSLVVKDFSKPNPILEINSNARMALGSEFKLYVLNYLDQQILKSKLSWSDKLKIQEGIKSLPSGVMQKYPDGTEFSLDQFAGLMISKSDNTATDHLINLLGKENIESSMVGFNSFTSESFPFLTTMDLFRIRTLEAAQVDQYLTLSTEQKRNFLNSLKQTLNRADVVSKLATWDQPKDIQKIEWYANVNDICSVVQNIQSQATSDKKILDILSINIPFVWIEDDPNFEYVGYKGGSEPGVLTMTFLVKTKNHKWGCISMGINNDKQSLDESRVADLFHAILNYSGSLLNN